MGQIATSITVAVPETESNGGLQVFSSLTSNVTGQLPGWIPPSSPVFQFLSQFNWSESCGTGSVGAVVVDECTLTAPQQPTGGGAQLLGVLTNAGVINDGDCDADDFVFGVPIGCDLNLTTAGDRQNQLFVPSAMLDLSTNGGPLDPFSSVPEPSALVLLLGGLGSLPFLQRRRRPIK
jgi:PEP-CTERM motif